MFTGDGALNARAVRELRGVMREPHCRPLQRVLHVLQHVMSDTLRADITQTPVVPLTTACRLSPSFPNGKLQSDPPVRLLDSLRSSSTGPRGLCFNDLIKEVTENLTVT